MPKGASQDIDGGPASYSSSHFARGTGQTEHDDALRRHQGLSTWCVANSNGCSKTYLEFACRSLVLIILCTRSRQGIYCNVVFFTQTTGEGEGSGTYVEFW